MKKETKTIFTFEKGDMVEITFQHDKDHYVASYLGQIHGLHKWAFLDTNSLKCHVISMTNIIEGEEISRYEVYARLITTVDKEQEWFDALGFWVKEALESYVKYPESYEKLYHIMIG